MYVYKKRFLLILYFFCIAACDNNSTSASDPGIDSSLIKKTSVQDSLQPGKVITKVICQADESQSYAVYIPLKGNREPLPVVYFFDSHGDGSYPLSKYRQLADSFNFIIIGSNNSKNGDDWPIAENIWTTMYNDSRSRLKIDTSLIYVCGFSGGAKVASYIALHHHEVKGVIANGAGLPDVAAVGNVTFSFTAIAGEGDLNMTELVAINNSLDKTSTNHRIIFFDGIHEWAPESTMAIAFTGLELDAMRNKSLPVNTAFVNRFITLNKKNIGNLLQQNNYLNAERICSLSINLLNGFTDDANWFIEKDAQIKNNKEYQKRIATQQDILHKEESIKASFSEQFQEGDNTYWVKTIQDVIAKSKGSTAESQMYQRLHAFLSLAFYSITNQLVNAKKDEDATHFDELYKLSDASNPEAWYLSAILKARNNNTAGAAADLQHCISLGFADKNRMMHQEEFQNVASQLHLTDILAKMK